MIDLAKRLASWLEMASVGCLLVGLFQGVDLALVLCLTCLAGSLTLTWIVNRQSGQEVGK